MAYDFDFQRYVDRQGNPHGTRSAKEEEFGAYAFSGDLRVLRKLDRVKPVRIVAESTVRFWKSVQKNQVLGSSVRISRRQFPELYDLTAECASTLDIPMPSVYVVQNQATLNAGTYGTHDEAFIILNSSLIDRFEENELKFIIGHECGHLQNNHVVYHTAVKFMTQGVGAYVRWAAAPATLALNAWSRRGEITCDRAGLVCCGSEEDAVNTMLKLAIGSRKLFEQMDVEEYLRQLDDIKEGVGRFSEYLASHPYLPKRIEALRLFAQSRYFQSLIGEEGGEALDEVDRKVEEIIQVF